MNLTARQIELVENSWDFVILNTKEAGEIFYGRLFTLDPSLRPLFKGDIQAQAERLIAMISFAVHKLNTISEIVADVKSLGVRHKNYNVKPEHYSTVAEALLWTLEKGLGSQWTDETKTAWITVYTILSKTMIDAANEA